MAGLCFFVHSLKGHMNRWIVLLRGVNVGGKNKLPMAELCAALADAGFSKVQSYIQSGNVVLEADDTISKADVLKSAQAVLSESFDIQIPVMVLTEGQLEQAATANPMGQEFEKPNWMFLFFLSKVPAAPMLEKLTALTTANERWELMGDVFYVYAGDGAGRSKLIAQAEKLLGVSATARNWKTVQKIIEMTDG